MNTGQQTDEQSTTNDKGVVSIPNDSKEAAVGSKDAQHEQDVQGDDGKDDKDDSAAVDSDTKKGPDGDEEDQYAVSWVDRPEESPMKWAMSKKWRIIGTLSVLSLLT